VSGGGSKSDDELRTYGFDFVNQPPPAYLNFARVWAFVEPSLTARLEFEMLDGIGSISARAVDARVAQRSIQQKPRRPDKRMAIAVFSISRLLANQHDLGVCWTFAEYSLSRIFPQRADPAACGFAT
jgi:hypothetical protein